MYITALSAYIVSKIIVSCCRYSMLFPIISTFIISILTYILYEGIRKRDPKRLKISLISFLLRLIFLSSWLLAIMFIHLLEINNYQVFKDHLIPRTLFIVISIIDYIISFFILKKSYNYYSCLRIVLTRGQSKELSINCCNIPPTVIVSFDQIFFIACKIL